MIDPSKPFHFSQSNLQDFSDCRRRFYLKYIQQIAWPAAEAEPQIDHEIWMRQGADFHQMVHQYLLGVPVELLSKQANREPLQNWWANFLAEKSNLPGIDDLTARRLPEYTLSAHLGIHSIIAKFDLLIIFPDSTILIYDWKTSRLRPKRTSLEKRLQTLVYPVVASQCISSLVNSSAGEHQNIQMNYWFSGFPDKIEAFSFDKLSLGNARRKIESLVTTISRLMAKGEDAFPLTDDHKKCTFCTYRSLCNRGTRAGLISDVDQVDDLPEAAFDFEQIGEIEF
jgi:hypothetical protein